MPKTVQHSRVFRLRDRSAAYGHALPFALDKKASGCGVALDGSPVLAINPGRGMPISRGSPPTST
jgi:hypothetical protein